MDKHKLVLSSLRYSELFPKELLAPIVDWIGEISFPGTLPDITVSFGLQVGSRTFVFLSERDPNYDDPFVTSAVIYDDQFEFGFNFRGKVEAIHLSRTRKSVIVETEEPRYLNGDPWIDYQSGRYVLSLNGILRDSQ